jgi:predicted HicB family RNase H-like nuclease
VAAVSKTSEPSPKLIDAEPKQQPKKEKQKTGRPPNEVNRVRFATYIDEDLNKKVRIYAAYNELKLNDVIEEALREYFKSKTINVNI